MNAGDLIARAMSALTTSWPRTRPQAAVHRTIVVFDVAGFSRRLNPHQIHVRDGLYRTLRKAFTKAGIPWDLCDREDRGDGVFLLAPPEVPKARFTQLLPNALVEALREYNRQHAPPRQIRLRMALHAGEINYDDHGAASSAINLAFRLIEAPELRAALADSVLALITSTYFFTEVVQHSLGSRPDTYRQVTVSVKETTADAWIRVPGVPVTVRSHTNRTVPRQLPFVPPFFAGRRDVLAQIKPMAMWTISGMGGIGKTWTTMRWAHDNLDEFPDGQLYVNLRGFDPSGEPTQVATAVRGFLDALGVAPNAVPADLDAMTALYRSLVAHRRMLILLDNAADSSQVAPLLPGSTTCTVLVTSRQRLTGLVIGHGVQPIELDVLDDEEAYELLAGRIGMARVTAEPAAVTQLLDRCAGLPLALGIVAAYAATHSEFRLGSLAVELDARRLDVLNGGELSANLRVAMSWSYHALGSEQARMFRLLGLMTGPAISVLGAAALTDMPVANTRELLRELADAHLIQQHTPGRYRMHDLVRLYAAECAVSDRDTATRRLVDFYLHAAYAAERVLYPDRKPIVMDASSNTLPVFDDDTSALEWFDAELPCLLAAQEIAARNRWDAEVWQLAWVLHGYLWRRGLIREQLTTWRAGLAAVQRLADKAAKALAHRLFGQTAARAGMLDEAKEHLEKALVFARSAGDLHGEARTHYDLAEVWAHDTDIALLHAVLALHLFKNLGNPVWEAEGLNMVGWLQAGNGNLDAARAACERALTLFGQNGNRQGQATTMTSLGFIAHRSGRYSRALTFFQDSLALYRELGDRYEEAQTLEHLGRVYAALGHTADAEREWQKALGLYVEQYRSGAADSIRRELASVAGSAQVM